MIRSPRNYENMSYVEYYAERQFDIDFAEFMANRMYPLTNTARMSRAEFVRYKLKQRLQPQPRKES